MAADAAQALAPQLPRRARAALPRGPAAARGPRVRDARVLPLAAHLGAGRLPLLPLGAARRRAPTRRSAAWTRARTSRTCARCSTSSTSTPSPARSATACTRAGTGARCSTASGRCTPTRTSTCGWRCTSRCTSWRVERFPESVDAFLPFNLAAALAAAAGGRLRRARGAGGPRDAAARARPRRRGALAAGRRAAGGGGGARRAALRARRRRTRRSGAPSVPTRRAGLAGAAPCSCCSSIPSTHEEYRVPAEVELRLVDEPGGRRARAVQAVDGDDRARRRRPAARRCRRGSWEVHVVVSSRASAPRACVRRPRTGRRT